MLNRRIEEFVSRYLVQYSVSADKTKFVHDPLLGTIEIWPHEQCLVDTPLLQRLRQVHQTGCVYATYPSASHTRFEHTLGVVHLASRMARALRDRFDDTVDETTEVKVRLAALLHDTGHSAFSHTTEEIYSYCSDLREELADGGRFSGKGAGEVLSYLIVTSDAFRKFFSNLRQRFAERLTFDVDDFAPLILGRPANPTKHYEADIISGPFDADKLDYFRRDSRAAGVRLSIDIDRLLHCIELVEVTKIGADCRNEKTWTLVVNRGGFNAVQQLLFARATLFSSVYYHHKVRACDCMIKAAFEVFSEKQLKFRKRTDELSMSSAGDFLFLTDGDYFAQRYHLSPESDAHKLIHGLLYRRLFRRILTISTHTILNGEKSEVKAGYLAFFDLRENPLAMRKIARDIIEKSGLNCSACDVWLDIPKQATLKKAGEALINVAPRNQPPKLMKLSQFIPVQPWTETYQQYYTNSYLFGPEDEDCRRQLAKAAVLLLKERYELEFNEYAYAEDISST
jgi:HD superfamily phosphohydrolase